MEKINLTDFYKRQLKKFYLVVYVITKEIKIRTAHGPAADHFVSNESPHAFFGFRISLWK